MPSNFATEKNTDAPEDGFEAPLFSIVMVTYARDHLVPETIAQAAKVAAHGLPRSSSFLWTTTPTRSTALLPGALLALAIRQARLQQGRLGAQRRGARRARLLHDLRRRRRLPQPGRRARPLRGGLRGQPECRHRDRPPYRPRHRRHAARLLSAHRQVAAAGPAVQDLPLPGQRLCHAPQRLRRDRADVGGLLLRARGDRLRLPRRRCRLRDLLRAGLLGGRAQRSGRPQAEEGSRGDAADQQAHHLVQIPPGDLSAAQLRAVLGLRLLSQPGPGERLPLLRQFPEMGARSIPGRRKPIGQPAIAYIESCGGAMWK